MGCWNGTCGISQMPIMCGDKVVLIPLIQNGDDYEVNSNGGGVCYSTAFFSPFVFPIVGIYDDYGCIELINEEQYQKDYDYFLKYFQFNILENEEIYIKKEHDDKILCIDNAKEEIDTIEKLLYVIERGRVKLKRGNRHIGYMLIHYDLYMTIITEYGNRKPYGKNNILRESFNNGFDDLIEKIQSEKDPLLLSFRLNSRIYEILKGKYHYYLFNDFFFNDSENLNILIELKDKFVDFICIQHVMDLMRKLWIPQAGCGSQCSEYMSPFIISKFIQEKIKIQREEHYGDENVTDDWMKESVFYFGD